VLTQRKRQHFGLPAHPAGSSSLLSIDASQKNLLHQLASCDHHSVDGDDDDAPAIKALQSRHGGGKMTVRPAAASTNRKEPGVPRVPEVFETLRAEIMSLQIPPGAPLSRTELQARFGVSSTPIRDALMRLAEEDIVTVSPRSATAVSLIDLAKARQAQFLRRSLEQECVRILAEDASRSVSRHLSEMVEQHRRIDAARDADAFNGMDQLFHRTLFEAAGAQAMWSLLRRQSGHVDRIRRLGVAAERAEMITREHARIVKAISEGDPVAAQKALRDHLPYAAAHWNDIRRRFTQHFAADAAADRDAELSTIGNLRHAGGHTQDGAPSESGRQKAAQEPRTNLGGERHGQAVSLG
jgi:GntR family transcriptional regulator, rspAB operon transcriptional repressor